MLMSAHQPAYLPWLGYFDKIKRSDLFVFLDTVQYEKNSYTNRNKIKTSSGPIWLSIPVIKTGHFEKTMREMPIDKKQNWQKKHLNSIYMNYKKSRYFDDIYPLLEKLYAKDYELFVDAAWDHLQFWLDLLGIETKVIKSSEFSIDSKKSDFVLDLCKHTHADRYLSGAMGRDYLEIEKFTENNISIEFQDYHYNEYPQLYGEFIPNMGIVDFVMNTNDYSLI